MALPAAVQRNVDSADAILNAANNVTPPTGDTSTSTQPLQAQPPVSAEQAAPQVSEETWQAKFHTLTGKYNAEVPRLSQEVRELQKGIQTLLAENKALMEANSQPVVQQAQTFTDSDTEAFGPDLVNLVDRVSKNNSAEAKAAAEEARRAAAQLQQQLAEVRSAQALSAKDQFVKDLTTAVPDWAAINVNQGFLRWLGETDPVYGLPRQAGLDNAYQALDAQRVARIFEAFKALSGKPTQVQTELQSQVAPNSSRGAVVPQTLPGQGKVWTQAEITAVYSDARRGVLPEAEAAQLFEEIDAAVREGRVR